MDPHDAPVMALTEYSIRYTIRMYATEAGVDLSDPRLAMAWEQAVMTASSDEARWPEATKLAWTQVFQNSSQPYPVTGTRWQVVLRAAPEAPLLHGKPE